MSKEINFTNSGVISGIKKSVEVISKTLGPKGTCVAIQNSYGSPDITRDGATVAKNISFKDPEMDMGAQLVKAASSKTEEQAGDGPQPLYTKILTPNGWVKMGDLKVGDKLCGTNGTIQEVIGVYPKGQKEIYEISFSNGQKTECCEDHLWEVINVIDKKKQKRVLTVKELLNKGVVYTRPNNGNKQYRFYTPKTKVEFEKKDLIIDPYLIGLLLGDGSLSGTGSIELSLGFSKENIIDKIVLPENIKLSISRDENKHYIRVKLAKIDPNGPSMHDYIKKVGLYGTKSSTKFIPKDYLYNSAENRIKLLEGLTSTDGYVNSKGLLEYSTVSKQLCLDLVELMRGLGKTVCFSEKKNSKETGSYSNSTIYRISELKGYKYGNKILDIKSTGKFTEMQCIKVSNPDELYITEDYIVTHNTSTTAVLIKELVTKGERHLTTGANINEIKDGMDKTVSWVTEFIKENSIQVDGDLEKIRKVATISANNDPEVGNLIVDCMKKVGTSGIIVADVSMGLDTTIDVVEGFKIERGWASPHFVTSPEDGKCVMENPVILVVSEKISSVPQIIPAIEASMRDLGGRPLLIICDDMDEVVMTTLVMNVLQGALRCCVVKGIDFGDNRKNVMEDIAVATGGTYICPEYGIKASDAKAENLGSCDKVVISKDSCIIYGGHGDKDEIDARLKILQARLGDTQISDYEKTKFEKRVSCLSGGIGIIKAGGASETEKNNRKQTIEDAILASKSAISEGVVPGGGSVFLRASQNGRREFLEKNKKYLSHDQQMGVEIVLDSLKAVAWTIGENSGVSGDVLTEKILSKKTPEFGYNAKTGKFGDLLEMGILDSAKALRVSLENATSAAGMCLLTSCVITDTPVDENKQ